MYSSIIEIKKSISGEALRKLRETAEKAFDNRAGKVENSSTDSHKLVFEGGEDKYGCLDLGTAEFGFTNGVLAQLDSWQWLDDDPRENCDVLKVYTKRLGY